MRHSQGQANPIMFGMLVLPLLAVALGAIKGCEVVRATLEPILIEAPAPTPPPPVIPPVLKGWRV